MPALRPSHALALTRAGARARGREPPSPASGLSAAFPAGGRDSHPAPLTFRSLLKFVTAFLFPPLPGLEDLAEARELAFSLGGRRGVARFQDIYPHASITRGVIHLFSCTGKNTEGVLLLCCRGQLPSPASQPLAPCETAAHAHAKEAARLHAFT